MARVTRYKLTRTDGGMLLELRGSKHRFVVTDRAVSDAQSTGMLRVRYVVPGEKAMHGMCILSGDEVLRAADRWLNDEYDHAVMILTPLMVESVKVSLAASEKFLGDWGVANPGQLYKFNLN